MYNNDDYGRRESDSDNNYSYYSDGGRSSSGGYDDQTRGSYGTDPYGDRNDGRKPKKKGFGVLVGRAAVLGLVFGLTAGGVMFGFNKASKASSGGSASSSVSQAETSSGKSVGVVKTYSGTASNDTASGVSDIVEQVMPSIVAVNTTIEKTSTDWFGRQYSQEGSGAGSGIIISSTDDYLYILTNYHVVEDSKKVSVQFDGGTSADATVKGYDEDGDIAVISVKMSSLDKDVKNNIKVAVMGDSDALKAGESAIAIGNALGYGQSVTTGVVSAVARDVQLTDKTMTLVQTSAAINPGNSGGALLNSKGEVIGVNTVKYSETDVEGMGYAIPINTAIKTAKGIIDGTIKTKTDDDTAYLGITGGTVSDTMAQQYNIPEGVYVSNVEKDSAAASAGLTSGCVITKFKGTQIKSMEELQTALGKCSPGDTVEMTVQFPDSNDKYSEKTIKAVLGAKSQSSADSSSSDSSGSGNGNSGGSWGGSYESPEDFFEQFDGGQ